MATRSQGSRRWLGRRAFGLAAIAGGILLTPWLLPLAIPEALRLGRSALGVNQSRVTAANAREEAAITGLQDAAPYFRAQIREAAIAQSTLAGLNNAITTFRDDFADADDDKRSEYEASLSRSLSRYNNLRARLAKQNSLSTPTPIELGSLFDEDGELDEFATMDLLTDVETLGLQIDGVLDAGVAAFDATKLDETRNPVEQLRAATQASARLDQARAAFARRFELTNQTTTGGEGPRDARTILAEARIPSRAQRWAELTKQGVGVGVDALIGERRERWQGQAREAAGVGRRTWLELTAQSADAAAARARKGAEDGVDKRFQKEHDVPIAEYIDQRDAWVRSGETELGELRGWPADPDAGLEEYPGRIVEARNRTERLEQAMGDRYNGFDTPNEFVTQRRRAESFDAPDSRLATLRQEFQDLDAQPFDPVPDGLTEEQARILQERPRQERAQQLARLDEAIQAELDGRHAVEERLQQLRTEHPELEQELNQLFAAQSERDRLIDRAASLSEDVPQWRQEAADARGLLAAAAGGSRETARSNRAAALRGKVDDSLAAAEARRDTGSPHVRAAHLVRPGAPTPASAPPGAPGTRTGPGPARAPR